MKEAVWIAAGVLVLCALVFFFWYQNNGLSVTRYRLKGMRVARPMKIVHLSDLHGKRFGRHSFIVTFIFPGDFHPFLELARLNKFS